MIYPSQKMAYIDRKKAKKTPAKNNPEKGDSEKGEGYHFLLKRARKTAVFEEKNENTGGTQKQPKRVPRGEGKKSQKRVGKDTEKTEAKDLKNDQEYKSEQIVSDFEKCSNRIKNENCNQALAP